MTHIEITNGCDFLHTIASLTQSNDFKNLIKCIQRMPKLQKIGLLVPRGWGRDFSRMVQFGMMEVLEGKFCSIRQIYVVDDAWKVMDQLATTAKTVAELKSVPASWLPAALEERRNKDWQRRMDRMSDLSEEAREEGIKMDISGFVTTITSILLRPSLIIMTNRGACP